MLHNDTDQIVGHVWHWSFITISNSSPSKHNIGGAGVHQSGDAPLFTHWIESRLLQSTMGINTYSKISQYSPWNVNTAKLLWRYSWGAACILTNDDIVGAADIDRLHLFPFQLEAKRKTSMSPFLYAMVQPLCYEIYHHNSFLHTSLWNQFSILEVKSWQNNYWLLNGGVLERIWGHFRD